MTDDSLNWLAMQYVLDELPASERDSFEERLTQDLAACEAVARATRLRLGLEKALADFELSPLVYRAQPERTRRPQFAVAAAGATLACAILVALFGPSLVQHSDVVQVQSPDQASPLRFANENVALISMWRSGMTNSEPEPSLEPDEMDDEPHELAVDESVPAWLLAGVSLEMNESQPGLPSERKDN